MFIISTSKLVVVFDPKPELLSSNLYNCCSIEDKTHFGLMGRVLDLQYLFFYFRSLELKLFSLSMDSLQKQVHVCKLVVSHASGCFASVVPS